MACKLDMHKMIHLENNPYICPDCGHGFKQPTQLRNHQVLHEQLLHPEEGVTDGAGDIPGQKDELPWYRSRECPYCTRVLATSKSLKQHILVIQILKVKILIQFLILNA
jgi:DNA-directed RNA polymerase subunit RPC12/RpoP